MLQARRIPQLLQSGLGDGVLSVALMTSEGSVLSCQSSDPAVDETLLGALGSSFWSSMCKEHPDLQLYLLRLEIASIGVTSLGKGFILAAYGDESVPPGFLKARMDALKAYLSRVVEQL